MSTELILIYIEAVFLVGAIIRIFTIEKAIDRLFESHKHLAECFCEFAERTGKMSKDVAVLCDERAIERR